MSPIVAAFLRSAALPAVLVVIAVFLTGKMKDPLRSRLQAVFLGVGFFVGVYLLMGRMSFPPHDAIESIAYAALVAALFVVIFPFANQAPYLLRAAVVFLLGLLLLWHIRDQLGSDAAKRNMIAFFCLGLGTWSIYERQVQRVNLLSLIGMPLITATCLSFVLLFNASASFSQGVSILCALLGGVMAVSLVWPGRVAKGAVVPFLTVFPILIMAAGIFYLNVNPWTMITICLPYLLVWIRGWLKFLPNQPVLEFAILVIAGGAPLAYYMYNLFKAAGPLY